jgi:hypothetical protein
MGMTLLKSREDVRIVLLVWLTGDDEITTLLTSIDDEIIMLLLDLMEEV